MSPTHPVDEQLLTFGPSFESRDVCEEVIQRYHGQAIGEECFLMQVRYADTPAQKELKRITAERRQYRTNEYNIGAYGTVSVGVAPTIYNTQPVWSRSPRFATSTATLYRGSARVHQYDAAFPLESSRY